MYVSNKKKICPVGRNGSLLTNESNSPNVTRSNII